jgi:sodium-coupled neutral amino acid transporter 11
MSWPVFPVALSTCDLGIVLEITGGLSATALAFVVSPYVPRMLLTGDLTQSTATFQFPAVMYYHLIEGKWHSRRKLPAAACAVFGLVVMVLSLLLALRKLWTGEAHSGKVCV